MPIQLALAGKDRAVLERLAESCAAEQDFEILARATTGRRIIEAISRFRIDVLVLDMRLGNPDAVAVLLRMHKARSRIRTVTLDETGQPEIPFLGHLSCAIRSPRLIVGICQTIVPA